MLSKKCNLYLIYVILIVATINDQQIGHISRGSPLIDHSYSW